MEVELDVNVELVEVGVERGEREEADVDAMGSWLDFLSGMR